MIGRCDGRMGLTLLFQFADDHHAFHEDAKPRDRSLQFGTRSFNSSNQFHDQDGFRDNGFSERPVRVHMGGYQAPISQTPKRAIGAPFDSSSQHLGYALRGRPTALWGCERWGVSAK